MIKILLTQIGHRAFEQLIPRQIPTKQLIPPMKLKPRDYTTFGITRKPITPHTLKLPYHHYCKVQLSIDLNQASKTLIQTNKFNDPFQLRERVYHQAGRGTGTTSIPLLAAAPHLWASLSPNFGPYPFSLDQDMKLWVVGGNKDWVFYLRFRSSSA